MGYHVWSFNNKHKHILQFNETGWCRPEYSTVYIQWLEWMKFVEMLGDLRTEQKGYALFLTHIVNSIVYW